MPRRATQTEASAEIAAPLSLIWDVMLDVARYPEWNPFIFRIDAPPAPMAVGQGLWLNVRWGNGETVRSFEVVTRIEGPGAGVPATAVLVYQFRGRLHDLRLVRAARTQLLEQLPDGRVRYSTWEDLDWALLNRFVPLARIQEGFDRHARALKARAEGLAARSPS